MAVLGFDVEGLPGGWGDGLILDRFDQSGNSAIDRKMHETAIASFQNLIGIFYSGARF